VTAAALAVWRELDTPLPSAPPPPSAATEGSDPLPVAWVTVRHLPAFATVDRFSGTVQSRRRGTLSLDQSGRVATVLVDEGDRVAAGAILLQLDTRELVTRRESLAFDLAQQQAVVAGVAADLPTAEATLERQERLVANGHATQQTIDEARSRVAVLKAEQLSAQAAASAVEARLRGVEVELETSVLKAPYAGTVTERLVDEGVAINSGTPLLTLVEDGIKRVRAGLPPEVAAPLAPGMLAPVEVGATTTMARLRALVPALDAATRTIPAVFEVEDPDRRLPDGALARLSLERTVPARGAWPPDSALLRGPRGLWTVYVLVPAQGGEDGIARVERRAVQILHDEAGRVFVDGTLEDGERVLAVGVDRVVPGQRVAPRPEPVPDDGVRVSDGTS
jgi:RND family efflux transporter MFP subunit